MADKDWVHGAEEKADEGYGDGVFEEGWDGPDGCFQSAMNVSKKA